MNKKIALVLVAFVAVIPNVFAMRSSNIAEESATIHYYDQSDWFQRLVLDVWGNTVEISQQDHSIKEFIGEFVKLSRDGDRQAVIAFLEKAKSWGVALDSVFYSEVKERSACFTLRHLVFFNKHYKNNYRLLAKEINEMKNIVCIGDVKSCSLTGGCIDTDEGFELGLLINLSIALEIPISMSKSVRVDITRQHN